MGRLYLQCFDNIDRIEFRKIAAILVADVVGYSRLAGADEDRTLSRLRGLRSDLIDPAIAAHHGQVVECTGDDILIEFRSVVDAVRCAIEVQSGMIERNAGLPPEKRNAGGDRGVEEERRAIYGEETRRPERSIPVATFSALASVAVSYFLTVWIMIGAVGADHVQAFAKEKSGDFLFDLTTQYGGDLLTTFAGLFFVTSLLAAYLALHRSHATSGSTSSRPCASSTQSPPGCARRAQS